MRMAAGPTQRHADESVRWLPSRIRFAIGYFKEYDDVTAYYLEEIVILADWQNQGFGKQLLQEIERRALAHGARHLELISVNDAHHMHFYKGFGLHAATNLRLMGKHYD